MCPNRGVLRIMEPNLRQAARELGRIIRNSPELAEYHAASSAYRQDRALTGMIRRFDSLRREFQMAQYRGTATPEMIGELRRLQADISGHPASVRYATAETEARRVVQEANRVISEILGVDFGAVVRAGACCP